MNKFISSLLWKIKNKDVLKVYKEIKKYENNFEELANIKLKKLLIHAKANVSFYKNIDIEQININSLNSLPIVTKDTIRNNFDELVSTYKPYKYWSNTSGGSTGEPVKFLQDSNYQQWVDVSLYYYYKDLLDIGWSSARKLVIWGSVEDFEKRTTFKSEIKNYLSNIKFINAFNFGDNEKMETIKSINSFKPEILKAYSNSLSDLAIFIKENNIKIYSPKVIVTSTAMLYDEHRKLIEEVFNTKVYDFYGSREASAIASEDKQNSEKKIFLFNNIIEVVDNRIIVTNLHNYTMPLIRFDILDSATSVTKSKNNYFLNGLNGRVFEYLTGYNNKKIHAQYFITLFFNIDEIQHYNLIQKNIDEIEILYTLTKESLLSKENKKVIENKINLALELTLNINWKQVSKIPKTKNGKYIYVRSEI
jgi:phenylacetate-CoA ligase